MTEELLNSLTMTPLLVLQAFANAFLFLCVSAPGMSRIEGRKFGDHGLLLRKALGRAFWAGLSSGFLAISVALAGIFLFHGFRITGWPFMGQPFSRRWARGQSFSS